MNLDGYKDDYVGNRYSSETPPVGYDYDTGDYEPDKRHYTELAEKGEEAPYLPTEAETILRKIGPGFVNDFVYGLRGVEAPTIFCLWGALFAVSSVLQRKAYLDFQIFKNFPNLYLLFIARPGVAKKSTAITFATDILRNIPELFDDDEELKRLHSIPIYEGKVTPEKLIDLLKPVTITIDESDIGLDFKTPLNLGSRLVLIEDELSAFLGKAKYNVGLVDRLTTLYDCKSHDAASTKKDGTIELSNIFFNFFAGTTPDGFRDSIPEEARGGGLMSRTTVVYVDESSRLFPMPQVIPNAPDKKELSRRLAWIAENCQGEYVMNESAQIEYAEWYRDFRSRFNSDHLTDSDTRQGVILLKVALLLAAQRYNANRVITEQDIRLASYLVRIMGNHTKQVEQWITSDDWARARSRVADVIRRSGSISRHRLMASLSRNLNARRIDEVIDTLSQARQIQITREGEEVKKPSINQKEVYSWIGEGGREDG